MQHVPSPADDYPEGIEAVVQALLSGGREAGAAALEPIAYRRQEIARRPAVPRALQAQVLRRDRFQCRYCGAKLIPAPIMELLGELYAEDFPFHPNWKGGQTHPAFLSRSPIIDHVIPGSTGGAWLARCGSKRDASAPPRRLRSLTSPRRRKSQPARFG